MTQRPIAAKLAGEGEKVDAPTKAVPTWKFLLVLGVLILVFFAILWWRDAQRERAARENAYNGFEFQRIQAGLWSTRIEVGSQPYTIPFYHHPRELEDIIVDADALLPVTRRPSQIFISIDPDAGSRPVVGGVEISRITGSRYNILNIPTRSALTRPSERQAQVPVVSCNSIPQNTTVIEFVQHNTTNAIVAEGDCVYLFYITPEDSVRVADRYAYELLQIM